MQTVIKISDAAIIAIHIMDFVSKNKKTSSAKEMSKKMLCSYNHLSKVLQRLTKENLISPIRGPLGGYIITEKGKNSTLNDILIIMEGKKKNDLCFLKSKICDKKDCILRNFLINTSNEFKRVLKTKIKDF